MLGPLDRARDRWFDRRMSRPRLGCVVLAAALAATSASAFAQAAPNSAADQARRRQMAAELKQRGVDVDWRLATLAELQDWSQRSSEVRSLRDHCGIDLDWRTYPLADLRDTNARCTRAAALAKLGVQVDWKAYTTQQLDELRTFVQQIRAPARGATAPILPADLPPGFDPDGIIIPSYAGSGGGLGEAGVPAPARKGGKGAVPPPPARAARPFVAAPQPRAAVPAPVAVKPGRAVTPAAPPEEVAPSAPTEDHKPNPFAGLPAPTKRSAPPKGLGPATKTAAAPPTPA
ncbi:MAG TPA: hypothetical protein VGK52_05130, partial [Polyangia bacterium]